MISNVNCSLWQSRDQICSLDVTLVFTV